MRSWTTPSYMTRHPVPSPQPPETAGGLSPAAPPSMPPRP
jgi:hypothetical protein